MYNVLILEIIAMLQWLLISINPDLICGNIVIGVVCNKTYHLQLRCLYSGIQVCHQ